jgi:hypothetical protein
MYRMYGPLRGIWQCKNLIFPRCGLLGQIWYCTLWVIAQDLVLNALWSMVMRYEPQSRICFSFLGQSAITELKRFEKSSKLWSVAQVLVMRYGP